MSLSLFLVFVTRKFLHNFLLSLLVACCCCCRRTFNSHSHVHLTTLPSWWYQVRVGQHQAAACIVCNWILCLVAQLGVPRGFDLAMSRIHVMSVVVCCLQYLFHSRQLLSVHQWCCQSWDHSPQHIHSRILYRQVMCVLVSQQTGHKLLLVYILMLAQSFL